MGATKLKLADDTKRKPPQRYAFTKAKLAAVPIPAVGDVHIHDTKQAGLVLRVRAGGSRGFYLIKKFKGRVLKMRLGDFPDMTIEQARKAAGVALVKANAGLDPMAERRQERAEATIGGIWKAYVDNHLTPRCSPRTLAADTWLFDRYLAGITSRRLGDLSQAAVKHIHTLASKSSKVSANRAVQLLRRLYNYAARHHDYLGTNPTRSVEMFPEQSRERFLSVEELPGFFTAAEAEGQPWEDFFKLCLFTGARRSNVQAMKWQALDIKAMTWTIPSNESKNGKAMTIPLAGPAIEILKRRREEQDKTKNDRIRKSEYVFPALRDKGETLHLSQPARPFERICKRAKIEGVTIHDLRRTAGAWMAASGASLPMIGKALGHADLRSTQIYSRLDLTPVRSAMEASTAMMSKPKAEEEKK